MHSESCSKLLALGLTAVASISFTTPAGAVQAQFTPLMDATLYEDATGDVANGSGEHLYFGRTGTAGNPPLRRALLRFDLAPIPPNASIESVSLTLEINKVPFGAEAGQAALHRVTASWGEGASAGEPGGDALTRRLATQPGSIASIPERPGPATAATSNPSPRRRRATASTRRRSCSHRLHPWWRT
jgi:hypothetical protein